MYHEDITDDNSSDSCDHLYETSLQNITSSDTIYAVYYSMGIFSISLICLVGNMLIIHAVLTSQQLHGAHNWFILSLACSDILQGLTIPFYTMGHSVKLEILKNLDKWINCQWLVFFVTAPQTISALNLVGITVIRYIAIKRPFGFKEKLDRHKLRVGLSVGGCWLFGIITACLLYLRPKEPDKFCTNVVGSCRTEIIYDSWNIVVFAVINVVLPVLIMFFLYWESMSLVRKQRKYLQSISAISVTLDNNSRMAKTVAFLLGYYTITWAPFIIYEGIALACSNCDDKRYVRATTRLMYFSNVAVNVFVYAGRVKPFREAFNKDLAKFKKYCCCCCKQCISCKTCCKQTHANSHRGESVNAPCSQCSVAPISNFTHTDKRLSTVSCSASCSSIVTNEISEVSKM